MSVEPGRLHIRVLGCGSSGGVPRVGNDWGECDPSEPRNRRSRCSLLVRARETDSTEETIVLIDTAPDLREQLLAARIARIDAVLFTHPHADQAHGLDDLRALAIRHRRRIPTYMDTPTADALLPRFDYCFQGARGYPAILDAHVGLQPGQAVSLLGPGGTIVAIPHLQDHGDIPSLGFRIGGLGYCNDVVRLPDESLETLYGLEVLMVDALRRTPHPTHASLSQALAWIDLLKPRHAILTNLHVDLDYRSLLSELPADVEPAYDGMEFSVTSHNIDYAPSR